ncbi:dihydroxyacetone kinase subunit DhaK [Mycobacterium sp. 21AC1]|uniref:dihydroxyacetone kinase subunit DhaK n=1 Tax=[Mycobacterium] appelbergii TaxID=2939269 RepID=UPI002938FF49|nr:dihydroxyacetone kinase subunit DhaK [Mycobacterium sp. 21AC1]MDV3129400.1 dihydroxyacetone kinase subunit DhaK [Mycobacterium sp. 21AC1]
MSVTNPTRLFLPEVDVELAALQGYCSAHADTIALNPDPLYVYACHSDQRRRVGLVSGGGSGHEPMHAGFVGRGGLDAAVPGRVFASPHNRQIYQASRRVAGEGGVLHLVKNYTGDRIHFGIAAERLAAEGVPVARVLVDDDIATESDETGTGRRGTGATVILEKLLGALADTGADLQQLKQFGDRVVSGSRSIAVASGPHTSFATRQPAFGIAAGTIEYGIGIHGEPAQDSVEFGGLEELVERMLGTLLDALPGDTDRVLVLVNGLGSTTALELGAISGLVDQALGRRGVAIDGALVGTYVSALDMRGFLLTLTRSDDERIALWLADAAVPGLPPMSAFVSATPATRSPAAENAAETATATDDAFLRSVTETAKEAHAALTRLDQLAGDGDFGDNLLAGVENANRLPSSQDGLGRLARSFLDTVGGSSGPLIGLVLDAIADETASVDSAAAAALQRGIARGMESVQRAGGASPGDRTMLDALDGACRAQAHGVADVVRGAADGAAETAQMRPRFGRASYVGERALGSADAGAVGIAVLIGLIAAELDPSAAKDCRAIIAELLARTDGH